MLRSIARSRVRLDVSLFKLRNVVTAVDNIYPTPTLCGSCDCGKAGYIGCGVPAVNFISHSSAPRAASNDPYLVASAFKPEDVIWYGDKYLINSITSPEYMPPKSSNPHYFCGCSKKQYLGVDASRLLGVVALNLKHAKDFKSKTIPHIYLPNHHVFYADRMVDVNDKLPKWKTGKCSFDCVSAYIYIIFVTYMVYIKVL